ncbi:MAG: hypothetical protein HQ519_03015 [Planctomycetes bacterium]|nr:hypothetical protein [Planctomycetota bacterium]
MRKLLSLLAVTALLAAPVAAQSCDKFTTDLYAGQSIDSGYVNVTNTGTHLRIGVRTEHDWLMEEVHIYAGLTPVPVNGGGNPSPGQFPYKTTYSPPVDRHVEMIPLTDLGASCGDTLYLAVHLSVVKLDVNGNVTDQETAWGFGNPYTGNNWGWWFNYDLCCCSGSNTLTLDVSAAHIGQTVDFTVSGATPGDKLYYFLNGGLVACDAGPAYNLFGGMHLDLIAPVFRLGTATANAGGEAVLQLTVPNKLHLVGQFFGVQAARANPAGSDKTDAMHVEILP